MKIKMKVKVYADPSNDGVEVSFNVPDDPFGSVCYWKIMKVAGEVMAREADKALAR